VTHPILSRTSAEALDREIAHSWARVRAETDAAVPIFCYPNGKPFSFGDRERAAVERAGLRAALTSAPRHLTPADFLTGGGQFAYAIPRFGFFGELEFMQVVSGVERAKAFLRGDMGRENVMRGAFGIA
jgi:hypothetical protein